MRAFNIPKCDVIKIVVNNRVVAKIYNPKGYIECPEDIEIQIIDFKMIKKCKICGEKVSHSLKERAEHLKKHLGRYPTSWELFSLFERVKE